MFLHLKYRDRVWAALALLVAVVLGLLWFLLDARFMEWRRNTHRQDVARNTRILQEALRQRDRDLAAETNLLAGRLASSLPGRGIDPLPGAPFAFTQLCLTLSSQDPYPLFIVTDRSGRVEFDAYQLPENLLAVKERRAPSPAACRRDALAPPLSAAEWPNVAAALSGRSAPGVFVYGMESIPRALLGRRLAFQSVAVPIVPPGGDPEGVLIHGYPFTDDYVASLKNLLGQHLAVEVGGRVLASTWGPSASRMLEELLSGLLGKVDVAPPEDAATGSWPLRVGRERFDLVFLPLRDPRGIRVGHCILFQERPPESSLRSALLRSLAVAGGVGLLLAVWLGWFLSHPLTSALARLRRSAENQRSDAKVPDLGDGPAEVSDLAASFQRLFQRLKDQQRAKNILGRKVSPEISRKILSEEEPFTVQGEWRRCAVLTARLTGLQPPGTAIRPEQWVGDLNATLEELASVVLDHQGTLDRFGNGTIQAVWGAPVEVKDQEALCLQAAFAMKAHLEASNLARVAEGKAPRTLGVGLHAGTLLAGYLGSEQDPQYTVLGPEAERSGDLARRALPGQVLASAAFQKALQGRAAFRRLGGPGETPGEDVFEVSTPTA